MEQFPHVRIVPRLKRAEGHLRSVIAMIEQGKPCLDLAQQLHAVEAAISAAKKELIHEHIESCLEGRDLQVKDVISEVKQLTKYL